MYRRRFNKTGNVEIIATYATTAGEGFSVCSGYFDLAYITEMYVDDVEVSPLYNVIATSDITTVKLKIATGNLEHLFSYCDLLSSAVLRGSGIVNTGWMFEGCDSLTSLDLSNFDTSKVTNMHGMFQGCGSLTSLDLSNFDTSKVTNMRSMFDGCGSLTSLDLSNFDTSKVTNMFWMFEYCGSLTSLDLSNFDTSKVTNMHGMFFRCDSLTSLDLSNFDTSEVTDMNGMFEYCERLTSLDLSNWDTSKVTDMSWMFYDCYELTSLDLSNWDTSKVTNMSRMFQFCRSLTSLDLSNFDTSKVTDMNRMFRNCERLILLNVSNWDTSNVTNMSYMFGYCKYLDSLDLSNWDTSEVTDMSYMFLHCEDLSAIRMKGNTTSTANMDEMFLGVAARGTFYYNPNYYYGAIIAALPSGWSAVALGLKANWTTQSGIWDEYSDSDAADGKSFTCVSPGDNGSTVIRCTFSGVESITFNCVSNGESNFDYLTIGELDTNCTRYSYGTTLKGTSGTAQDITFTCDPGTHYVEFCYSKDGGVSTSPDNATVYIKSYQ